MKTSIDVFKISKEKQSEIEGFINDYFKGKDFIDVPECIRSISKTFTGNAMKLAIWGIAFKVGMHTAKVIDQKKQSNNDV